MIRRLSGTVERQEPGALIIDAQGVGYSVSVPLDTWEKLSDKKEQTLWIHSYIREDRFDLYGFQDRQSLKLFETFIAQSGIGPKLGLELCSAPRALLSDAATLENPALLTQMKGIGKKMAEKLVIELKNMQEKDPAILGSASQNAAGHAFDEDAIAALSQLGYDSSTILQTLKNLPPDLGSTEERVTAALRSL